jgi:hypothetical protein
VTRISLALHDQAIELRDNIGIGDDLHVLFGAAKAGVTSPRQVVTIASEPDGSFSLQRNGDPAWAGLTRGELLDLLQDQVSQALITDMTSAVVLHAGVVSVNDRAILLAGPTGSGKTSLAAWFVANGFKYVSDDVVAIVEAGSSAIGFPRAMVVKADAAGRTEALLASAGASTIRTSTSTMIGLPPDRVAAGSPLPCGLIIFPKYEAGAALRICNDPRAGRIAPDGMQPQCTKSGGSRFQRSQYARPLGAGVHLALWRFRPAPRRCRSPDASPSR